MKWQEMVLKAFQTQGEELAKAVQGLTVEELNTQPMPDCNSIGWLVWHVIRSVDRNMSEIMGEEQLWIKDKWYAKFGREPDPNETGVGHTFEQAKNFKSPAADVIVAYHRAILNKVENYINYRLDENELGREYISPTFKQSALVGNRITGQFFHGNHHIGQADYARGQLKGTGKGKGWFGR
jgi:hypothetical protein